MKPWEPPERGDWLDDGYDSIDYLVDNDVLGLRDRYRAALAEIQRLENEASRARTFPRDRLDYD